uniref:Uncharacterized protein n=1 Tax=Quercus lobata TaxID=97700 RepID=A0A7N2MQ92_QUELO
MKAGNNHRLKGRSLSLTLVVLVITTIALWAWEKNHFANTLLLAQEWYIAPSSGKHAGHVSQSLSHFSGFVSNLSSVSIPVQDAFSDLDWN